MGVLEKLGQVLTEVTPEQEQAFAEALRQAHSQWKGIELSDETFADFLLERLTPDRSAGDALAELCVSDLFLACACQHNVPGALDAFDREYSRDIAVAYARSHPPMPFEEAQQVVREHLLVGTAERPPRIALYRGDGSLRAWVRVATSRLMINLASRAPKDQPTWTGELGELAQHESPELAYLRQRYREEFKHAFEQGLAELTPREREVLRLAICERASVDAIGERLEVHRATAARWVVSARENLERAVQQALRSQLQIAENDIQSMLRVIGSEIDLSVSRLLGRKAS